MIAVDATWSSRADLPSTVGHRSIARADWPARDLRLEPPPGSYVIVAEMDWRRIEDMISTSQQNTRTTTDRLEIDTRRRVWNRTNGRTLDRILRSLDRWLVLSDVPRPPVPVPGLTTAFVELKPAVNRARFERDLSTLLASLGDRVPYDEQSQTWSYRLLDKSSDPMGMLGALAWGLAGSPRHGVIVGGWGASVIEANRERLERE